MTSVSATAPQRNALATKGWLAAVSGSSAKPTARSCTTVLAFAAGRAGTEMPRRPTHER